MIIGVVVVQLVRVGFVLPSQETRHERTDFVEKSPVALGLNLWYDNLLELE
jgi:hypothetical protein